MLLMSSVRLVSDAADAATQLLSLILKLMPLMQLLPLRLLMLVLLRVPDAADVCHTVASTDAAGVIDAAVA